MGRWGGRSCRAHHTLTSTTHHIHIIRPPQQYKWITFKIDDSGKWVIPDRVGGKASPYDDFLAALPANECRYGVYDYDYTSAERGSFSKIVFVNW